MGILDRLGIARLDIKDVEAESDEPYTSLFASSPEMLEALIAILSFYAPTAEDTDEVDVLIMGLDAIEKATNRTWVEIKKMMEEE